MAPQLYYRTEYQPIEWKRVRKDEKQPKWKRVRKDRKQPNRSSLTPVHKLIHRQPYDFTSTHYVKNGNWAPGVGHRDIRRTNGTNVTWVNGEHVSEYTTPIDEENDVYRWWCDCDYCTQDVPEAYCAPEPQVEVDIMDIARVAKPKGVAKEFEILDSLRRVLVEDDFELEEYSDEDDWERIDDELAVVPRSYSAVVRGHER